MMFCNRDQYHQRNLLNQEMKKLSRGFWKRVVGLIPEDKVRMGLPHLKPDQQQVIALKYLEGKSIQEVAEILGKPVGAVRELQHRALLALYKILNLQEEQFS